MQYPDHIVDPQRIEIGKQFIAKRHRKLFPNSSAEELLKLDSQLDGWINVDDEVSVRDFWDKVYAYKFETARKYWVNYLTAENVSWELVDEPIENVRLIWPRIGKPNLGELFGDPPYSAPQIKELLAERDDLRQMFIENSDFHANDSSPRDHFPCVGVRHGDQVHLEDGNRRGMRAILHDKPTLHIWVATIDGEKPKNYWVSTGWFWQLVLLAVRDESGDLSPYKEMLQRVIDQSEVARHTYEVGVANGFFGERNPLASQLIE